MCAIVVILEILVGIGVAILGIPLFVKPKTQV
jgi:hypothetical protein